MGDLHRRLLHGHGKDNHNGQESSGQGNEEIAAELVLHRTALTVAGGDGGIGNHGQVVAEHRAAHNGTDAQCRAVACSVGYLHSNGRQQRDGTHGGAHGRGDKAADHKQHCHRKLRRNDGQHEVRHALGTGTSHHAHKRARRKENQQHGDDILIPHALTHNLQLLIKRDAAVLYTGGADRHQEGCHDRHIVKAHGNLHAVLKQKTQAQIQYKEHADRQQRRRIALLHSLILRQTFQKYIPYEFTTPKPSSQSPWKKIVER